MLVRITNPRANNKSEQEFLVKKSVESARVGRKGIIFHLDVEATAGGWTVLEQIAAVGPKELLVQYMTDMTQSGETATTARGNAT